MGDRQRRTRTMRAVAGGVVLALMGAGATLAASQSVAISNFAFSPSSVTVSIGDTVTWTNSDAVVHTATADDASWDAGNIPAGGGTGAVVFTAAGTFPYHCTIHTQMAGTVTVQAAAATAAPTAAPTAGATLAASDAAPIGGSEGGAGAGWVTALVIAALAATVGVAVLRRQPVPAVAGPVASVGLQVSAAHPSRTATAAAAGEAASRGRSVAPVVVVAVASAVAVAVVWRRLTSRR